MIASLDSLIQEEFVFSPFLVHWDCSRILSQHPTVLWLECAELLHPHGQGDTLTLSSATGRFWECRCSYSNPHISKVSTQKCSLKSYPLFMPRTTQRQISVHSLQSQTLQGHCCSSSSQHTTSYTARLVLSVAVQPSWALTMNTATPQTQEDSKPFLSSTAKYFWFELLHCLRKRKIVSEFFLPNLIS